MDLGLEEGLEGTCDEPSDDLLMRDRTGDKRMVATSAAVAAADAAAAASLDVGTTVGTVAVGTAVEVADVILVSWILGVSIDVDDV